MDRRILDILLCPQCGETMRLADAHLETVTYNDGLREEIREGIVKCDCGRSYPVADFVLSFADLFPPILKQEAAFWERYYLWLLEHGSYGFHDLRCGLAPYITVGVPEPFPAADTLDRYDIHYQVAEHPLVRQGRTLLDVGVGLGWTSLHFARAGYKVAAFEPSLGTVKAAKRYAMGQGIFVEYICASLETISFAPASFDTVTAFHSLHHVPDLEAALREVKIWLRPEGALAVDEHVGNSRLAAMLGAEMHRWAESEVFPRYRSLPPEALADLPQEPHSALEDSSVDKVAPCLSKLFEVQEARPRHVFLDHYPLLYYLDTGRDATAYKHALAIANQIQEMVRRVDPDGGDYITIIAKNSPQSAIDPQEREDTGQEPPSEIDNVTPDADSSLPLQELVSQLAAQGAWARSLEQELQRKNSEIAQLRIAVQRLESGRVMRLLRLVRKVRARSRNA